MYRYNDIDKRIVRARVEEFRDQVRRRLDGELTEEDFLPLRLQNGLYNQRLGYMLRIGVPYGLLSSAQMRTFALIAERYDRGFGHFTTRQNIQFNHMELEDVPDILGHLAEVEMHAIQTSGNCVRNVTCDPHAGVAPDELADPRPLAEMLRQYKELHPEFAFLPRKFKIAISGAPDDRAATFFHDIGIQATERDGALGWRILVGGGIGRTPRIAAEIRDFLPTEDVMSYVEAVLRVYNLHGRRDNKYKARIKILVGALGIDAFRDQVDAEWAHLEHQKLDMARYAEISEMFASDVIYDGSAAQDAEPAARQDSDPQFARWLRTNVMEHKTAGHHIVYLSLKAPGCPPGDVTTAQLLAIADMMDQFSHGRATATYNQNLTLPHVRTRDLEAVYDALIAQELASANINTIADSICCPGIDYCNLGTARSIPVAQKISARFDDPAELEDIGKLHLNMSGCVNACGHHHTGHIGILGVDKAGVGHYQIAIGGHPGSGEDMPAAVGEIIGPAVPEDQVIPVLDRLIDHYRETRTDGETFLDTVRRVGAASFREEDARE
jgi:sulfite reductase (NADPH) hemoprotein beta-component